MRYFAEETIREHGTVAGLSLNINHPVLKRISIIQVNVTLLFVGSMTGLIVPLRFCASRQLLANLDRRKRLIMSKKDLLISEIEQVPEPFLDEVLDFVHFLKTKIVKERLDTAIASESSLKKDWLRAEEDEAW